MSFNVDIFNKQLQANQSDYGTYSVVVTADLLPYATISSVDSDINTLNTTVDSLSSTASSQISSTNSNLNTRIDNLSSTASSQISSTNNRITSLSGTVNSNFLPLTGGRLSGNLALSGTDGQDKSLILYSPTVGASAELKAAITFIGFNPGTGLFEPEPGVSFPRILIREGRLDLDPDTIFTRAEFRVSNVNTQFNIYNKDLAKYYLRIRPNGGFEAGGTNLTASGNNSHAEGDSTVASGLNSHAEGTNSQATNTNSHAEGSATRARGAASHAEGVQTIAQGAGSHSAGRFSVAAQNSTWIWRGSETSVEQVSTTRASQFMVSAEGGAAFFGNVGIGTDSIANPLTVVGNISASGTVFSSGAPVVVSTSTFETPTTGISAISNIVALSQATYDALTVKLPTTLYVIISS